MHSSTGFSLATMEKYPFREYRKVAYVNSTGICNLDCPYCFTNNSKKPVSLANEDMDYLFEVFGENFLLCFSGQGDFFAGYKKKDRFLENLLKRDVKIYLDFNGVLVHELFEMDPALLEKVHNFDVSFHYETMKTKGFLEQWTDNTIKLSQVVPASRWAVKTIVTMSTLYSLHEKLDFYASRVFPETGKPLKIVLDDFDNSVYSSPVVKLVNSAIGRFPDAVIQQTFSPRAQCAETTEQGFRKASSKDSLWCPAGSLFFKIQLDGTVVPCNKLFNEHKVRVGNLKEKQMGFMTSLVSCSKLKGPGCIVNWDNKYPQL